METIFSQEMAMKLYTKEIKEETKEETKEEERLAGIRKMAEGYLECEIAKDRCLMMIIDKYPSVDETIIVEIVNDVYK